MTRTTCMALLVGCLALGGPDELWAQVRDTTRADTTERPFVRGGMYDKPFLTRLNGRSAIGGYAEAHMRYERVEGLREALGFEAKRFNLFANASVSDWVRLGAELEFEEGAREIALEFAAIDLRIHPALTLRGGMLLSPLGRFNLAHDSPLNVFTDRPLVSTELLGVALSEPGVGALGQLPVGREGRVTYEIYATNGFHDGLISASAEGTRIPLGTDNFTDNNASPALVARVAWSPRLGFELGVSSHRGAYNVFAAEGVEVDERRSLRISVVDAELTLWGTTVSGEGAIAQVDVPDGLRGVYAERQHGLYVEAERPFGRGWVRTMPGSAFSWKVRAEGVDFDADLTGDDVRQLSVGVNFRPTQDSVLKFDYVRGQSHDRFNNRSNHAFLLASIATYF